VSLDITIEIVEARTPIVATTHVALFERLKWRKPMSQRTARITLLIPIMLFLCLGAFAQGKPGKVSDIPVSSSVTDYDATNIP